MTGVVETCGDTVGAEIGTFPFIGCGCWVIGIGNKLRFQIQAHHSPYSAVYEFPMIKLFSSDNFNNLIIYYYDNMSMVNKFNNVLPYVII